MNKKNLLYFIISIFILFLFFRYSNLSIFNNSNNKSVDLFYKNNKKEVLKKIFSKIAPELNENDLTLKDEITIKNNRFDRNVIQAEYKLKSGYSIILTEDNLVAELWTPYKSADCEEELSFEKLKSKSLEYIKLIFPEISEGIVMDEILKSEKLNRTNFFYKNINETYKNQSVIVVLRNDGKLQNFAVYGNLKKIKKKVKITKEVAIIIAKKEFKKEKLSFKEKLLSLFSNDIKILSLEEFVNLNLNNNKRFTEEYIKMMSEPQIINPDKRSTINKPRYAFVVELFFIKDDEKYENFSEYLYYIDSETGKVLNSIEKKLL